ncbi:WD40 repeat-like protein [Didymella exigua CBS 183.55]|uniref:WD40 repeat-like protein n=1 Tax=Didymella exigua CBS 183.55 TaxID=1150837 RepID=A0A6A5RFY0_9PLEO|nr:WD40 repeat-like protein [Didymella exigua CBS 183.55]KAF1926662.1 WD40 repeat-like protein [Didymella exigua CBS 183.55]
MPSKNPCSGNAAERADHLLIFLKEVKRLKWSEITKEYLKHVPGSNYGRIQSRYSTVLNKRDRTQDPPRLNLPPKFAAEASIDWATVHSSTRTPHVDKSQVISRALQQTRDDGDSSSSGDWESQRQRSRRAAPVNYRWPKGGLEESADAEKPLVSHWTAFGVHSRSELPRDEMTVTPSRSSMVRLKPLDPNFKQQDAKLGVALQRNLRNIQHGHLPYLSSSQRLAMRESPEDWMWDQSSIKSWQGAILHIDFSPVELLTVETVVAMFIPSVLQTRHSTYRRRLRAIMKDIAEPKLHKLAHEIGRHLRPRNTRGIMSFLEDAAAGKVSDVPHIQRLASTTPYPSLRSAQNVSVPSCVLQRELGLQSRGGRQTASRPLTYQLRNQLVDTLGLKSTWTGASSDIHTVAWTSDGQFFAAGAVAVTDTDSMQYNRPNVLLYGDTTSGKIHELGEHCVDRPKAEVGANSTHAMFVSQDSKLYTTVTSVAFSPSGRFMYSAGYDHCVCIWNVSVGSEQPYMIRELQHKAPVDVLAVNPKVDGIIATATKCTTDRSIKLVKFQEDDINDEPWQYTKANFASAKAMSRPDLKMSANALKFDPTGQVLLAGFGANMREDSGLDTSGDICLWDVEAETALQVYGSSRNVFDVTFNAIPRHRGLFAVGCVANGKVNRGTRSVVRFYTPNEDYRFVCPLELECQAFDMNDIVWCPYDEHLFAAGCTDGRSYLWDLRRGDRPLSILSHGSSLMPLQDGIPHERTDTGVRFLSWGQNARRLYSGSSDGVVKVWDIIQSPEDMFVRNLFTANSGIMAGAFTSDYTKLVLGEVNGTANVLEVGRDDITLKDADTLTYHPYVGEDDDDTASDMIIDTPFQESNDTAAAEARKWLRTGQLRLAPMGGFPKQQVVQGPSYEGPFDRSEDAYTQSLHKDALQFQRTMAIPKGPQCDLPGCADNINTTTYEDIGDSGRSADRIPDELRRQWLDESRHVVPGKAKCTYCTRPAIPSPSGDDAFCERHSFACFRCGGPSNITGATSTLECRSCGGTWDVGALGYECSQQPEARGGGLDVPALNRFGKETDLEMLEDVDTSFGDKVNALTDFYFGLAIDRPESPSL